MFTIMITIQYKQMTKKINRVSALVHPTPYEIETRGSGEPVSLT